MNRHTVTCAAPAASAGAPGRIVSKQQSPSFDVVNRPKPANAGGGSSGRAGGGA